MLAQAARRAGPGLLRVRGPGVGGSERPAAGWGPRGAGRRPQPA